MTILLANIGKHILPPLIVQKMTILSGSKREHWIAAVRELQIGNTRPAMRLVSKGRSIMGGAAESNQDDGAVRAEAIGKR
jgi:hypothetical protein